MGYNMGICSGKVQNRDVFELRGAPIDPVTLRGHDRSGEKCEKETRVMHTSTHRI